MSFWITITTLAALLTLAGAADFGWPHFLGFTIGAIIEPWVWPCADKPCGYRCPLCGAGPMWAVIHYCLPHWLCPNEECHYMGGWPSRLTAKLPWNGWLLRYPPTRRGYWRALWRFLRRGHN